MSLSELFVRHLGHRLWLSYKGELQIITHLKRFRSLLKAPRAKFDRRRLTALRNILSHAATTSEYYRQVFEQRKFDPSGVRSFDDIKALPLLTKDDLNSQMERILSSAFRKEQLVCSSTGGSSGTPLTFYRDQRATMVRRAQDYLFNAELGIYPGVKRAWVWGSQIDAFSMAKFKARVMNYLTERAIYFYSFDATPDSMNQFLRQLKEHRPKVIFAYPNMLAAIAAHARSNEVQVCPVEKVIVTAEPLFGFQRDMFREVFGAETFERYGSREIGTVAAELADHNGMYLFEPCYYFEVLDEQGREVPAGEMGELVVTDFYNYAMPLIRYRTGDMVRMSSSGESALCTWSRLTEVGGRVVDMLVRPDGSSIAGESLIMALRKCGTDAQVQIVQTAPNRIVVKYLESHKLDNEQRASFSEQVNKILRAQVDVAFESVQRLGYDKSGKYRYVTSECGE